MCEFKKCNLDTLKLITLSICFISHLDICFTLTITQSNNILANRMHAILTENEKNILVSPISIHAALSVCYQGANGATANILQTALNLTDPQTAAIEYKEIIGRFGSFKEIALYMANNVYFAKGYRLNEKFKDLTEKYFMADIEQLDFTQATAADHINKWVSGKTHGKIDVIVTKDDLDLDTRAVIINAIYFKASWKHPFSVRMTHPEPFYISEARTISCDMMKIIQEYFYKEHADLNAKLIRIPYVNSKINLIIILPNRRGGIHELEWKLANSDIINVTKGMILTEVILSVPRFKIEASIELNEPLMQMGLENIFSDAADFSNMIDSDDPIKISKIIHKTFMEINENGTTATASTEVIARRRRSVNMFQVEFTANRPFIYYVVDSDSTIIFLGTLNEPNPVVVHDEL